MPYLLNPPTIGQLLGIILNSYDKKGEIFDIPEKLFYKHWHSHALYTEKYGQKLQNPLGLASGPHTQMAQNIVSGWLCGARFIELKTVQPSPLTEIHKPSMEIRDGAFNCERSDELDLQQAYDQFLNAWIIIHVLHHKLFMGPKMSKNIGTIFNMSLGYTLADIRGEKMQWFIDKMINCSEEKLEKIKLLKPLYPEIDRIVIPDQISNNFTINTGKGCSARELEYICKFLMVDKKLYPTIKFDPTLMGYKSVQAILSAENSFDVELIEEDFEDSIQWGEAIKLIESISLTAKEMGLDVTIKIANGLVCKNTSRRIPGEVETVYLSGRALHPIAVNLAAKFQTKFEGLLDISFSGGADCFNIVSLIQSGFKLITVATDLLKPGGYGRLYQYFQEISKAFANYQAKSVNEFILKSGSEYGVKDSALENLRNYAIKSLNDPAYKKNEISGLSIKSSKPLEHYDCISAPCTDASANNPKVADYCWFTTQNDAEKAINAILADNPLPSISGMISQEPSRLICTRINYDYPVLMKDVERFVAENESGENTGLPGLKSNKMTAAIIGGGVSGLACAWYLKKLGFGVDIYEADMNSGGILRKTIPEFRITDTAIFKDIQRIKNAGIKVLNNTEINKERFDRIKETYDYIYISTGASIAEKLNIEGEDADGVIDSIYYLSETKLNKEFIPGKNIAVVGNGWIATDVARTAKRILGNQGTVTLITNGGLQDMEVDKATQEALLDEEIDVFEGAWPKKILTTDGHVSGLELVEIEFVEQVGSTARKPLEVTGVTQAFAFDTVIPCNGRKAGFGFLDVKVLKTIPGSRETKIDRVFAGGAIINPCASFISAIADAKEAAIEIAAKAGIEIPESLFKQKKKVDIEKIKIQRTHREKAYFPDIVPPEGRNNFNPIVAALKPIKAIKEAARCLQCDVICNVCVAVCPNRAMIGFEVLPADLKIPSVTMSGDDFYVTFQNKLNIHQKYQILNIADWCNECGNCTTFCPKAGSPNRDKFRVHFNRESFNQDTEGFLLTRSDKNHDLTMKRGGLLATLTENWDALIFENDDCLAVLDKKTFEIQSIDVFTDKPDTFELPQIPEMKIIYRAVQNLL